MSFELIHTKESRSFLLMADEELHPGFLRIFEEELSRAINHLESDTDRDKHIHETRKILKKLRGLLRMIRDQIGPAVYHRENLTFRDLGRHLSTLRDIAALEETMQRIEKRFQGEVPTYGMKGMHRALKQWRKNAHQELIEEGAVMKQATQALRVAQLRMRALPWFEDSFEVLAPNLGRLYRRNQRGLQNSRIEGSNEAWHEWRKKVKYLWFATQILENIWPVMMFARGEELHRLSDLLGDDHDLAILQQHILAGDLPIKVKRSREAYLKMIDSYRLELQQEALSLGDRLFQAPKAQWLAEQRAWWKVARKPASTTD